MFPHMWHVTDKWHKEAKINPFMSHAHQMKSISVVAQDLERCGRPGDLD